ncbi:MAG TPA: hypothetical protein VF374_07775 [Thermoplasmata archaeon]|jgi:hypothetical protein
MRKEFESELAKRVAGKKAPSKAWVMVALCAAVLVCGAVAVTAVAAGNGEDNGDQIQLQDPIQDRLMDGSCEDSDGDGICDNFVDADGDGICDLCTCPCST